LKRQLAQRIPFTNFRSELSAQSLRHLRRKTTALFLFRTRGKPRPARKKTWAAAKFLLSYRRAGPDKPLDKPRVPKRPPDQKATSAPLRGGAGVPR
jgi:hypothetical protein